MKEKMFEIRFPWKTRSWKWSWFPVFTFKKKLFLEFYFFIGEGLRLFLLQLKTAANILRSAKVRRDSFLISLLRDDDYWVFPPPQWFSVSPRKHLYSQFQNNLLKMLKIITRLAKNTHLPSGGKIKVYIEKN